ncbi:UPF0496 protein At4g34320-like [Rutidosis leptorrhynchoides]|uniref:UPF0496 protein At4g34320-like n=1 Tax=Rutidosis leptorrhynchoides TaxID=125765 RepID=UPI003A999D62
MGCICSTKKPPSSSTPDLELNPDLTSYQSACRSDPTIQSFDSTIQARTNRVISTLSDEPSLSIQSLQVVIDTLLATDQDVLKLILEYETDVWTHDELFSLVKEYLEISLETLDFCKSVDDCLKNARSIVKFLQTTLDQYAEDANHLNTIEQFKIFKSFDTPFSDKLLTSFRSVYDKQVCLLNKLRTQTVEVVKKLESIKIWRRLSNVIYVATFSTVLICSVVAAVVALPPLVTALAAAATLVPLGSMGMSVDSLWKTYEQEVRYKKKIIIMIKIQSDLFVIKDLDNIKAIVDRMGIKMEGILKLTDFVIGEEVHEALGVGVDEITNPVNEFAKMIDDLGEQSVKTISDIKRTTTMILERIKEHPRRVDNVVYSFSIYVAYKHMKTRNGHDNGSPSAESDFTAKVEAILAKHNADFLANVKKVFKNRLMIK